MDEKAALTLRKQPPQRLSETFASPNLHSQSSFLMSLCRVDAQPGAGSLWVHWFAQRPVVAHRIARIIAGSLCGRAAGSLRSRRVGLMRSWEPGRCRIEGCRVARDRTAQARDRNARDHTEQTARDRIVRAARDRTARDRAARAARDRPARSRAARAARDSAATATRGPHGPHATTPHRAV